MNVADIGFRRQLMKSASGGVAVRVAALAATLLGSVVLARVLGPAEFGRYAFVFAIVSLLALPAQAGIPTLLLRETAMTQARRQWGVLKGLWRWSTRVIAALSAAMAVLVSGALLVAGEALDPELRLSFFVGLALVPLIALGNARGAALRGMQRVVIGQLPESIVRPVLLLALVGVAGWYGPVSASAAMGWHVVAAAVAFAIGAALLWRARPVEIADVTADTSSSPAWWRAALPLALVSALQVASNQTGVVVLGFFRPASEVGLFKVAASAATVALFGMQTITLVISPHIARLHATGDAARLARLVAIGAIGSAGLTVPILLVFVLGGRDLIGFVYGGPYRDAYAPLVVLAAGQAINSMFGCVAALLGMTGHERDAARWLAVSAAVNTGLAIILAPAFGSVGVALAGAVSIVVWNVAFWHVAKRRLGIDASIGSFRRAFSREGEAST